MKKLHNKNYRKYIIILCILFFILIIMNIILSKIENDNKQVELKYDNLSNVKEVIEYYKSIYLSEEESSEPNFYLNIFLELSKLPYEKDDTSNEEYYNNLINDISKVIYYRSFKMFDQKNDITIEVICKDRKIDKIIINGMEDFFIYHDSQISMKQYKEIPNVELQITSEVLQNCIENNWDSDVNFGTRDSIFEEYYIYFDEGIKVKNINNKICNIIFDKNYNGNVINSFFPGIDLKNVEAVLGSPAFEDEDTNVIGYKSDKIYVFFTDNEISIYRRDQSDTDEFFKLADEYLNSKIDLLEFMNQLTYMWPDYSEYTYNTTSVFISYPLKGIEIKINYDDTNGILVYNNIRSSLSKIYRYMEKTEFVAKLQLDSVFESEKRRLAIQNNLKKNCDEYLDKIDANTKKIVGESMKYGIIPLLDNNSTIYSIKFISLIGDTPNRQLNDSVDSYLWKDNDTFIYSKKSKGIFLYDLNTGVISRIVTGKEEYVIKGYENGILKYDKKEIEI